MVRSPRQLFVVKALADSSVSSTVFAQNSHFAQHGCKT